MEKNVQNQGDELDALINALSEAARSGDPYVDLGYRLACKDAAEREAGRPLSNAELAALGDAKRNVASIERMLNLFRSISGPSRRLAAHFESVEEVHAALRTERARRFFDEVMRVFERSSPIMLRPIAALALDLDIGGTA